MKFPYKTIIASLQGFFRPEYIRMCQYKEIQSFRQKEEDWELGDFFLHTGHREPLLLVISSDGLKYGDMGCSCCKGKRIWLPRIDQTISLLGDFENNTLMEFSKWYIREADLSGKILLYPEEFWLAFYMERKHNVKWNGRKWLQITAKQLK